MTQTLVRPAGTSQTVVQAPADPHTLMQALWSIAPGGPLIQPGAAPRAIIVGTPQNQRLVLVRTQTREAVEWRLWWQEKNGRESWIQYADYRARYPGVMPHLSIDGIKPTREGIAPADWCDQLLLVLTRFGIALP